MTCSLASPDAFFFLKTAPGDLQAWGKGREGELGKGVAEDIIIPQKIETLVEKNTIFVTSKFNHSMAVTQSGQLWTWGGFYSCALVIL